MFLNLKSVLLAHCQPLHTTAINIKALLPRASPWLPMPSAMQVKHRCGLKRTNAITCEALQEALYYKLRWRGKVWETLTLAALWLRDGDLTKLQLLLNRMQELKDDDETLEEMRALFQVRVGGACADISSCRGSNWSIPGLEARSITVVKMMPCFPAWLAVV